MTLAAAKPNSPQNGCSYTRVARLCECPGPAYNLSAVTAMDNIPTLNMNASVNSEYCRWWWNSRLGWAEGEMEMLLRTCVFNSTPHRTVRAIECTCETMMSAHDGNDVLIPLHPNGMRTKTRQRWQSDELLHMRCIPCDYDVTGVP